MWGKKDKFCNKKYCSILNNMIILLAISLIFQSCSGMKSIRNGNVAALKNGKKVVKDINESENKKDVNNEIADFEKLILENKKSKVANTEELQHSENDLAANIPIAIPSINDQLSLLKSDQDKSKIRIDKVEERLDRIEKILASLQEDLDLLIDKNKETPMTGAQDLKNKKQFTFASDNEESGKSSQEVTDLAEDETFLEDKPESKKIIKKVTATKKKIAPKPQKQTITNTEPKEEVVKNDISQNVKIQQGINELKQGNYKKSIQFLNEAKAQETSKKNQSIIAYNLADAYFKSGDYQNSMVNYASVIQNNNSSYIAESQMKLAESNLRLGKVGEAKLAYQKLIASFPDSQYVPIARKMLQQL